ncbi:MAG: L-2-amino-thiazoline-4-carboxylic acid hydrolase, partial [Gammaproteobacteria bacterium]
MAKTDLPILEQRRIEANVIKPIFEEMVAELGEERAKAILGRAIRKNAIGQGQAYAQAQDAPTTLGGFHALLPQWMANGALEVDFLTETESEISYNVTRCQYA